MTSDELRTLPRIEIVISDGDVASGGALRQRCLGSALDRARDELLAVAKVDEFILTRVEVDVRRGLRAEPERLIVVSGTRHLGLHRVELVHRVLTSSGAVVATAVSVPTPFDGVTQRVRRLGDAERAALEAHAVARRLRILGDVRRSNLTYVEKRGYCRAMRLGQLLMDVTC